MTTRNLLSIVAVAGLACPAMAQDSVSNQATAPLPGDALDAYAAGNQVTHYVVDLAPFTSKLGGKFGVAPVMKSSAGNGFPTQLVGSQAISADVLEGGSLFSDEYNVWTTPGQGINSLNNDAPADMIAGLGTHRVGAAFAEFGGAIDNIVAGEISYDPNNPGRLYVTRVQAAHNSTAVNSQGFASLAFGSIDADLNTYIRADDFGACCVTGNNVFRVRAAARNNAPNLIQGNPIAGADAGATDALVSGFGDVLLTPQNVPQSLGSASYFGPSFDNNLRHGPDSASISTSFNWITAPGTSATRGTASFNKGDFWGQGVGTSAMLEKSVDSGADTDDADQIISWGVNADGSPSSSLNICEAPLQITDNADGVTVPFQTFNHYGSQTPFQGGTGQVASAIDADGNLLLAASFNQFFDYASALAQNTPDNAIAVCRVKPDGTEEWTLAAYYDIGGSGLGKPILNASGQQCGELIDLGSIPGAPQGPNSSAPSFDSAGNCYFVHAYLDYGDDLMKGTADDRTRSGLFRSVYNGANFSYNLDLMLEFGGSADPIMGLNSGREYRIDFVSIADSNSVSSGAMYSSNTADDPFPGAPAVMDAGDERALGGLVFGAGILYDSNGDGIFNDGFDLVNPIDEEYNVLMYVHPLPEPAVQLSPCADVNRNGNAQEPADFTAWLTLFNNPGDPNAYRADVNNNGNAQEPADFTQWLTYFNNPALDPADCLF